MSFIGPVTNYAVKVSEELGILHSWNTDGHDKGGIFFPFPLVAVEQSASDKAN